MKKIISVIGSTLISTVLTIIIISCFAWSYTYDVTTPLGSDSPSVLDNRIREIKSALEERLDIDHFFDVDSGTVNQVDDADTGKHRQLTLWNPIDTPDSVDANEAIVYSKLVNGLPELHYIDDEENERQLTSAGNLYIAANDINESDLRLSNDAWLRTRNAAGTADVNVVKVDANDTIILADGAELDSNTAPTTSAAIANKQYVDDQVGAISILRTANVTILNNATTPSTWTSYDLSGTVTANPALCIFRVELGQGYTFGVRPKDGDYELTNGAAGGSVFRAGTAGDSGIIISMTDSSGFIQYKGNTTINSSTLTLIGWIN
jgi:hypothetical protein